jgi:phosphomannomutase/phosphoglucomutase
MTLPPRSSRLTTFAVSSADAHAADRRTIGQTLGTLPREGPRGAGVGRDGRLSGPELAAAVADGIRASGANVIDVGMVTTPMSYFAASHLDTQSSVMVTGSHNPPDYNGLKMVIDGVTLSGDDIQGIRTRIEAGRYQTGAGSYRTTDIASAYYDRVTGNVRVARPLKIAVDCGNGVAGGFAPTLYRRLGCEVTEMYCEVDGRFPNHHPDPSKPENLRDLIAVLAEGKHDLGFAFDGDGDRLGVVTRDGHVIYPDRQLMLFAADVLTREPGATIIYDVSPPQAVDPRARGVPPLWKTGHSLIKSR